MSTVENKNLEEQALEIFVCAYQDYKIDDLIHSCYIDSMTQWKMKEMGWELDSELEEIFEWLLERDYDYTLRDPLSAVRYFAEDYYDKYNK